MAEFAYNNAKNISTVQTPIEFQCGFYSRVLFKTNVDPYSGSCLAKKLADELRELIKICCQTLLYAQELQKRAQNQGLLSWSYATGEKTWLNSNFIKTKQNRKIEKMFFGQLRILYVVKKQAYKLELHTK